MGITAKITRWVLVMNLLLINSMVFASQRYITQFEGQHISLNETITTVFISAPDIADYNVIDEKTIVVFAKEVGQARLEIYGKNNTFLQTLIYALHYSLPVVYKVIS